MGEPASSITAETFMQDHEKKKRNIYVTKPSKNLEELVGDVYLILTRKHLENIFYKINNLHQNFTFTIEDVMEIYLFLTPYG